MLRSEEGREWLREVGEALRRRRLELRLTQREVAAWARLPASVVSRLERGAANPTLLTLHAVSRALRARPRVDLQPEQGRRGRREPGNQAGPGPATGGATGPRLAAGGAPAAGRPEGVDVFEAALAALGDHPEVDLVLPAGEEVVWLAFRNPYRVNETLLNELRERVRAHCGRAPRFRFIDFRGPFGQQVVLWPPGGAV